MKRMLLVGYGKCFRELLIKHWRDISCFIGFYDNHFSDSCFAGSIPLLDWDDFIKMAQTGEYKVIITASTDERIYYVSKLREHNIEFEVYETESSLPKGSLHISGIYPELVIDANIESPEPGRDMFFRTKITLQLFLDSLSFFRNEVHGMNFDLWVTVVDEPEEANDLREMVGVDYTFAYCTTFAYDHVIPIPDYRTFYDIKRYEYDETPEKCRKAVQTEIKYKRALFIGTLLSHPVRRELIVLADKTDLIDAFERNAYHPNEYNNGDNRFIPMLQQTEYKYLIDAPGWTWSDRTKVYLQLGRPILLIDRPYKEWFFEKLEPMKHYVPVRRDLSDLVEKIEYLDRNDELYEYICRNALEFSDRVFRSENILEYVKEVAVKYGVK